MTNTTEQWTKTRTVAGMRQQTGESEWTAAGEILLPDYCPDVAAVLTCCVSPYLTSVRREPDGVTGEGTATVRILYLDEERNTPHSATVSVGFTGRIPVDDPDTAVFLTVTGGNGVARATSPRRLEVRVTVTAGWTAELPTTATLLALPDPETEEYHGLVTRTVALPVTRLAGSGEKKLTLQEAFPLPEGVTADGVMSAHVNACVSECKLLSGKAILKGEATGHWLMQAPDGMAHTVEGSLPFRLMMDVPTGDGNGAPPLAMATATVLSTDFATEEAGTLAVQVGLRLSLRVYQTQEERVVTDAYHTGYPLSAEQTDWSVTAITGAPTVCTTVGDSTALPTEDWQEIVDVWMQPLGMTASSPADGKCTLTGRMLLCLLVRDGDGTVSYFQRPESFPVDCPADGDAVTGVFTVGRWQVSASGTTLHWRAEVTVCATVTRHTTVQAVSGIEADDRNPYPTPAWAVKVYYADEGEDVWDIAKECHVSPRRLCRENALTEERVCQGTPLIISG